MWKIIGLELPLLLLALSGYVFAQSINQSDFMMMVTEMINPSISSLSIDESMEVSESMVIMIT